MRPQTRSKSASRAAQNVSTQSGATSVSASVVRSAPCGPQRFAAASRAMRRAQPACACALVRRPANRIRGAGKSGAARITISPVRSVQLLANTTRPPARRVKRKASPSRASAAASVSSSSVAGTATTTAGRAEVTPHARTDSSVTIPRSISSMRNSSRLLPVDPDSPLRRNRAVCVAAPRKAETS